MPSFFFGIGEGIGVFSPKKKCFSQGSYPKLNFLNLFLQAADLHILEVNSILLLHSSLG